MLNDLTGRSAGGGYGGESKPHTLQVNHPEPLVGGRHGEKVAPGKPVGQGLVQEDAWCIDLAVKPRLGDLPADVPGIARLKRGDAHYLLTPLLSRVHR